MKYIWEEVDIYIGRRVWSNNRTEEYIIGYDPSKPSDSNWAIVSLANGAMIVKNYREDKIVINLNLYSFRPSLRDEDRTDIQEEIGR